MSNKNRGLRRRRAIDAKPRTEKCADAIFAILAYSDHFGTKQQAADPPNDHSLNFYGLILIGKRKPHDEFHTRHHLMISEHPKAVARQVHHRALTKEFSTHVIQQAPNRDTMVCADHKLAGLWHGSSTFMNVCEMA